MAGVSLIGTPASPVTLSTQTSATQTTLTSAQLVVTAGTVAGALKIQGTNDPTPSAGSAWTNVVVQNFGSVPLRTGSSFLLSAKFWNAAGSGLLLGTNLPGASAYRVVYIPSDSTESSTGYVTGMP